MNRQYAIWWTTSSDTLVIFDYDEDMQSEWIRAMPGYVQDRFFSRYGRNGRGRLWTGEFPIEAIEWHPEKLGARYAKDAAGIVIRMEDVELMKRYPGIVTDLDLNII